MPKADDSNRIINFQKHSLAMDKNGVTIIIYIDRATLAPSENTNAGIGKERNAINGEKAATENEHRAPEGKVVEIKRSWCDGDDTNTHATPVANENIDAHQPIELKHRDVNDENDVMPTPEQTKTQRQHSCKIVAWLNKIKGEEVRTRKYAVGRIIGQTEKNGRAHYAVGWHSYTLTHDAMRTTENLPDDFTVGHWSGGASANGQEPLAHEQAMNIRRVVSKRV